MSHFPISISFGQPFYELYIISYPYLKFFSSLYFSFSFAHLIFFTIQSFFTTIFTRVQDLHLMPCPFTGPKIFCAGPNILCQPKNLTAFSASSKTFVPAQKIILLTANHSFCLAQNVCDCHNM